MSRSFDASTFGLKRPIRSMLDRRTMIEEGSPTQFAGIPARRYC